jgi:Kef-type K+ transport system membrane component KefB
MAIFMGGTPFGAPLVGAVAEAFGARWSLIAGGAISATATGVAALLLARRSGLQVRGDLFNAPRRREPVEDLAESVLR